MRRVHGWRVALRVARRDVARSRRRTALVLLMVGLPVLLVSVLATLNATNDVSTRESLGARLGTTQAELMPAGPGRVDQNPEGLVLTVQADDGPGATVPSTAADLQRLTGGTVLDVPQTNLTVRTRGGRTPVVVVSADLRNPRLAAMAPVRTGRSPRADDEVLVSEGLARRGLVPGRELSLGSGDLRLRVVGVADVPELDDSPRVWALPSVDVQSPSGTTHHYLLDRAAPVLWPEVRRLNAQGVAVLARAVVTDPPPHWRATLDGPSTSTFGTDAANRAVAAVIVFAIVLEVILLAGPAFAVGVRRQQRALALVAAAGGTPRDVRRIVLFQALVIGGLAAVAGAAASIPVSAVLAWALPRVTSATLGPFEVAWGAVLGACALGTGSAVVAAFVPAATASRADVVAALAGRRGQPRPRRGLPILGAVLMAAGAAVALLLGTRPSGEFVVVGGSLLLVVGAIAVVPSAIAVVGRLAGPLPLPLRLAARDSARQRARTAPAVAAVMAAVAGATALAIGGSSDAAQARRDYLPRQPTGVTTVSAAEAGPAVWRDVEAATERVLPGRTLLRTGSVGADPRLGSSSSSIPTVYVVPDGCPDLPDPDPDTTDPAQERCAGWRFAGETPTDVNTISPGLVAELPALRALGYRFDARQERVLRDGGVLVPAPGLVDPTGHARVTAYLLDPDGSTPKAKRTTVVPAALAPALTSDPRQGRQDLITRPRTADRLGIGWFQDGAVLSPGPVLAPAAERALSEAIQDAAGGVEVYTERGYHDDLGLPLLGLAAVTALAVLVGTLTATGLALADARPDLATLAAVGARPRTRRAMAAAQALVIGLLGTGTGIAVGAVPGLAVTWPLTADSTGTLGRWGSPTIDVPWLLLLGMGVVVPLLAAVAAGLAVRSRLPLTRRIGL